MSMQSLSLDTLIRPRLLVVSARYALTEYDRRKRLPRLLGLPVGRTLPDSLEALAALIVIEQGMEQSRRRHDASWRAADHVAVLTAMLHEVQSCAAMGALGLVEAVAPSYETAVASCSASNA